jgi:hypothetical protein
MGLEDEDHHAERDGYFRVAITLRVMGLEDEDHHAERDGYFRVAITLRVMGPSRRRPSRGA